MSRAKGTSTSAEKLQPETSTSRTFPLDASSMPASGWAGWAGPLIATAIGAWLRLAHLGRPHAVVFDETYYVKDALSLLRFGYEHQTVDDANEKLLLGNDAIFTGNGSFVVHPPVGKWLIALGEKVFGATPFGWRIVVALIGVASILVAGRAARRLARSNVVGTMTAMLLAFDGLHIAMSRTALLDMPLSFFALCAFAVLIWDRDERDNGRSDWRLRAAMTVLLGLATATKWSGLYFAAAFIALMLWWDFRRLNADDPQRLSLWSKNHLVPALLMPTGMLFVYLLSWTGWFRNDGGWDRQWQIPGQTQENLFTPLRRLLHYHAEMLHFHTHLHAAHNYRANPLGWPIMLRPTSFFWEAPNTCPSHECAQEVIALGNPLVWWLGVIAIAALGYWAFRRLHSAALPLVAAFLAGWAPWLLFMSRTTFQFYSVAFVPYTAIALALVVHLLATNFSGADKWTWPSITFLAIATAVGVFFYPVAVGSVLDYSAWHLRMWFPGWI